MGNSSDEGNNFGKREHPGALWKWKCSLQFPSSSFQLVLHPSFLSESHFISLGQGVPRCSLPVPFPSLVKILAHCYVLEICKSNFLLLSFPNNSLLQIMLLTDPEIESSLLISSDEGATYQKYRLSFYIQSLLFHPKQEDWILAYSQDQKVSTEPCLRQQCMVLLGEAPSWSSPRFFPVTSLVMCSHLNRVPVGQEAAKSISDHWLELVNIWPSTQGNSQTLRNSMWRDCF